MGKLILLCDDSLMARMMLQKAAQTVAGPDDEIIMAENGDHALEQIGDRELGVAILDYNMPGMDGLKLARQLRHRQTDLPIALCSANIQNAVMDRAAALDVVFIPKPVNQEKISTFIRESI